jgi:hypothetical protein
MERAEERSHLTTLRWIVVMFRKNGWGRPGIIPPFAWSNINGSPEVPMIEAESETEETLPVYFLHIAKTGGTSLTAALKAFFRPEEVISDAGNISVDFIKAQEQRLHAPVFVHGHAQHGVMSHLMGRVRAITFLRDPPAQAVSNYLHVARDLDNPLSCAAVNLGFSRFLTTYWQYAVYQVNALDVSITPGPAPFPEDLERRVGDVFALLDQMFFVGCLEQLNEVSPLLSLMLRLPACLTVPRFNTAAEHGTDAETIQSRAPNTRHCRTISGLRTCSRSNAPYMTRRHLCGADTSASAWSRRSWPGRRIPHRSIPATQAQTELCILPEIGGLRK